MSTAELDTKLKELLKLMLSRLPADKKLTTPVVQQLLRVKYAEVYPAAYIAAQEAFITEQLALLLAARESAANKVAEESSSEDDDDDDSDDASDDEEDDDDEEESDEEDDDESLDDDEEDEDDDEEGQPERKKARLEEEQAFAGKAGESVADQCKGMVECLKKLGYRVRLPEENESLDDYLHKYLVEEFKSHNMEPNSYDKNAVRRYKLAKEVELLRKDGGNVGLDRRARAGRGFTSQDDLRAASGTSGTPSATQTSFKTSKFLDEE